ncbi:MAG: hypothetical protein LUH47_06795 [Clostridiales bacterium]|nr:hypothetical protein [Clostridiales bacterium]
MEKYFLGLDGGSTYLKAVLMKDRRVIDTFVCPTGIDSSATAEKITYDLCEKNKISRRDISILWQQATAERFWILQTMIYPKLQPMPTVSELQPRRNTDRE